MCCNGLIELFNYVCKDNVEEFFNKIWGDLCYIYIVFLFYNYDLFNKFIKEGVNVNRKIDNYGGWIFFMLVVGNDI